MGHGSVDRESCSARSVSDDSIKRASGFVAMLRPGVGPGKGKNKMKKLAVIILACLTTSLYADLGDDYNTCLKQLEKTGKPVHHDDTNGYARLQAQGVGIQSVTL